MSYTIISGNSTVSFVTTIQPIARYPNNGTPTGSKAENAKHFKEQETK